ncbi:MAG: hypothetical protein Ct9H300mP14_06670 [Gammaproteobacteria bacterium]|nr:MAG: hypothetical protein Ct9H300mP14_06670 [Gammaproteobacteria bacterium]
MIGLRKIQELSPDVITLDIEMPGMDGLTFLEKLMKSTPLPVVMVSAYTEAGSETALRVLNWGGGCCREARYEVRQGLTAVSELIIEKVKAASQARVDTPATRFFSRGRHPETCHSVSGTAFENRSIIRSPAHRHRRLNRGATGIAADTEDFAA